MAKAPRMAGVPTPPKNIDGTKVWDGGAQVAYGLEVYVDADYGHKAEDNV